MSVTELIVANCHGTNIGHLQQFNFLQVCWRVMKICRCPNSPIVTVVICVCDQCMPGGHDEYL